MIPFPPHLARFRAKGERCGVRDRGSGQRRVLEATRNSLNPTADTRFDKALFGIDVGVMHTGCIPMSERAAHSACATSTASDPI